MMGLSTTNDGIEYSELHGLSTANCADKRMMGRDEYFDDGIEYNYRYSDN